MAIYNEILVGRYARLIQKLFSMKGSPPVRAVGGEITPSLQLFLGAEARYLEGWDMFGISFSQAGAALNQAGVRLRNPAGSNVIAVFMKIAASAAIAQLMNISHQIIATDLGTIVSTVGLRLDGRGRNSSSLIVSSQSTPSAADLTAAMGILSGSPNVLYDFIGTDIVEFPLLPGEAVQITTQVVNTNLNTGWLWRERFLEDSERT